MLFPKWYGDASPPERLNYLIGLVALHASPQCSIRALAPKIGIVPQTVVVWKKKGGCPIWAAMAMENLVGREVVRWEMLVRPDQFPEE